MGFDGARCWWLGAALSPACVELQHQRELDVVAERIRLVVVERVVQDREDALGWRRVWRVRRYAAQSECRVRELHRRRGPPRCDFERVIALLVLALCERWDLRDERVVKGDLALDERRQIDELRVLLSKNRKRQTKSSTAISEGAVVESGSKKREARMRAIYAESRPVSCPFR